MMIICGSSNTSCSKPASINFFSHCRMQVTTLQQTCQLLTGAAQQFNCALHLKQGRTSDSPHISHLAVSDCHADSWAAWYQGHEHEHSETCFFKMEDPSMRWSAELASRSKVHPIYSSLHNAFCLVWTSIKAADISDNDSSGESRRHRFLVITT